MRAAHNVAILKPTPSTSRLPRLVGALPRDNGRRVDLRGGVGGAPQIVDTDGAIGTFPSLGGNTTGGHSGSPW